MMIELQATAEDFTDLLNNHKKFVAVTHNDVIVTPAPGDLVRVYKPASVIALAHFDRVVTHVQPCGASFFLSLRPLGKAEK